MGGLINLTRKNVDERGELRYINDEPHRDYTDSLEYENTRSSGLNDLSLSTKSEELRVPKNKNEADIARQAEQFLKDWGV